MSGKKIITVFGATGNQGGSVVNIFVNDSKLKNDWAVRGITRDVNKESSKKLASQGVEVVSADINDKASITEAIRGSYAVFAMTNYWEYMDMNTEIQQGKNMADAAKDADVKFLIWSSVLNITKLSNGVLSEVYHFDSKATVEEHIRELGIPATFFLPGFYMTNLPGQAFRPSPPDNAWTLGLPIPAKAIFPMFYPADTGKYIKAAVLNESEVLGKRLLASTEYLTGQEVVDGFKQAYPAQAASARYRQQPDEEFRGFLKSQGMPDFAVEELHQNMRLLDEFGYYGGDSLEWTHSLVEDHLTTWEEYAKTAPGFAGAK